MPSAEVARQPLSAPLNDNAKQNLTALQRRFANNADFANHVREASKLLSETVTPINEGKVSRRLKHNRHVEKAKTDRDPFSPEEEAESLTKVTAFEKQVESVTEKMDKAIRQVVDDRIWNENLSDALKHVTSRDNATPNTQQTTQRSILPTQDATPRGDDDDDEETAENNSEPPTYEDTPYALMQASFTTQTTRYNTKTLTERYAHDNDYTGWYRSRHDGLNGHIEPPPPVPAPALWFGREEGRHVTPMEDEEVGVVGEKISLKCPLTLVYFKEPVTSDLCQHSYEKTAILDMLKLSAEHVEYTPDQLSQIQAVSGRARQQLERQFRVPRTQCPEASCNKLLTEKDLRANPFLQRQAMREQEKIRLQQEKDAQRDRKRARKANNDDENEGMLDVDDDDDDDDEDEDDVIAGTQRRPVGLGSSPDGGASGSRARNVVRLKMERSSGAVQVPSSQRPRGSQPFAQSSDEGEDEDD